MICLQSLDINIIGVNTFDVDDDDKLRSIKKVEYKHIQVEFTSKSHPKEADLIKKLQATGLITGVKQIHSGIYYVILQYEH